MVGLLARNSRRPRRGVVEGVRSRPRKEKAHIPPYRDLMGNYSLDSNIITKLLKKHPGNLSLIERFRSELQKNSVFIIPVVFYEVRRELILKKAATQES